MTQPYPSSNHDLSHNERGKENIRKANLHRAGLDKADSHIGIAGRVSFSGMGPLGILAPGSTIIQHHCCNPYANIDVIYVSNNATSGLMSSGV